MLGLDNIGKTRCVLIYPINKMYAIRYQMIKLKYTVRNSKKTKLNKQKTMCTRIIFATVLSPTIKIFHRLLGPNLYIFAVKVSPWFHRHFTVILWHITDISPRKNTDQGDFLLKCAVRAVCKKKVEIFTERKF